MTNVPYTFGNEPSPIPLSQLDANFATTPSFANTAGNVTNPVQANITAVGTLTQLSVTGNIVGGNLATIGNISANSITGTGSLSIVRDANLGANLSVFGSITGGETTLGGNASITGFVSASGNVTGANLLTTGRISGTGNIDGGNLNLTGKINAGGHISTVGNITTTGNIATTGNVLAQGVISAVGDIITDGQFIGAFQGSIVGNIVGAPGSNTQVLFNTNGNVDAVGGLTYNKGSNVLTVLGAVSAQGNVTSTGNLSASGNANFGGNTSIGGNANIGGNISVGGGMIMSGGAQISGVVTGPTAPVGTANNQLATTVFVSNQINQYANAVAITGGTITVTSLTASSVTANTVNFPNWTVQQIGGTLYFQCNGNNIASLDPSGNFTTIGNVTAFGTL